MSSDSNPLFSLLDKELEILLSKEKPFSKIAKLYIDMKKVLKVIS